MPQAGTQTSGMNTTPAPGSGGTGTVITGSGPYRRIHTTTAARQSTVTTIWSSPRPPPIFAVTTPPTGD
ncbi:hypothetical protein MAR_027133, partial [Mya arenaria]